MPRTVHTGVTPAAHTSTTWRQNVLRSGTYYGRENFNFMQYDYSLRRKKLTQKGATRTLAFVASCDELCDGEGGKARGARLVLKKEDRTNARRLDAVARQAITASAQGVERGNKAVHSSPFGSCELGLTRRHTQRLFRPHLFAHAGRRTHRSPSAATKVREENCEKRDDCKVEPCAHPFPSPSGAPSASPRRWRVPYTHGAYERRYEARRCRRAHTVSVFANFHTRAQVCTVFAQVHSRYVPACVRESVSSETRGMHTFAIRRPFRARFRPVYSPRSRVSARTFTFTLCAARRN